jgi:hypothetical protein
MTKVLWTQKQDVGPSARGVHAIAYDSGRNRIVLFGGRGQDGALDADTWEWDGSDWTQVADTGPDARSGHALAYDSNRQRCVLVGGEAAGGLRGDTWEWDGTDWTQVADTGPDARSRHALAYDSSRQRTVLFGGEGAGSALRNDTWEWDGTDWTQVADTGPDARSGHALTFDGNRQRTVLFAGEAAGSELRADTWEWDGANWKQVADTGPGPSVALAMAFGPSSTLLFGGITSSPAPAMGEDLSRMSWEWDGKFWTLRQDMGPVPRWGHALAFDSNRGRAVLFGGFSQLPGAAGANGALGDTWEAALEATAPPGPGPDPGPGPGPDPAGGISLVSFTITPDTITGEGDPNATTDVTFEVGIDTPAPPGGVQVDVFYEGQPVLSVLVPDGQTTGSLTVPVQGDIQIGDYQFQAQLGGSSLDATLHVTP